MRKETRKITKEVYDAAMAHEGRIPKNMKLDVFGYGLVYGYGIDETKVRIDEKDGYVVDFIMGDSCD